MKKKEDSDPTKDRIDQAGAVLDAEHEKLRAQLRDLEDRNSAFPATREFLDRVGVKNVRDLSPEQERELRACLEAELKARTATDRDPAS